MDNAIRNIITNSGDNGLALYTLVVIIISAFLCGAIGVEREFNGHAAGLRTHIIIGIAATMVGIICQANAAWSPYLIAAVVIALGFLSAGSIVQTGKDVKGITTSSTIWVTGIIGAASGLGYILEAIILTIISLIVLVILAYVELKTSKRDPTVTVFVDNQANIADEIVRISSTYGLKIRNISSKISKRKNVDALAVKVTFNMAPGETVKAFAEELANAVNPLSIDVKVPRIF
jgi:putative Mg2+ transporter-C (MgtC) family protein